MEPGMKQLPLVITAAAAAAGTRKGASEMGQVRIGWAALAMLAILLPGAARAGEAGEAEEVQVEEIEVEEVVPEEDVDLRMQRRLSIDMKGKPFADCLDKLRAASGVNVVASQRALKAMAGTPVTFALKDVNVWGTIHLFARSCGLEADFEGGAFFFDTLARPDEAWARVNVRLHNMDVTFSFIRREVPRELRREMLHRLIEALEGGERGERGEEEPGDGNAGAKPPVPPRGGDLF